jgi:glutaminyl-peptide cyclotransferase
MRMPNERREHWRFFLKNLSDKRPHGRLIILISIFFDILIGFGILGWYVWTKTHPSSIAHFDGEHALKDVAAQVAFGPRIPTSEAHAKTIAYIQGELAVAGWQSSVEMAQFGDQTALNILATRNTKTPVLLLGAHYDSRLYADNDPNPANHTVPVPGANDGASGVAVLLELARTLPIDSTPTALLFIDIEDNGRIPGWDWILGSRAFAANLPIQPKAVVIIDMIGDADLNIYMEKNSDAGLTNQIWKTAKKLGYETAFIPVPKYRVEDDHLPFIEKGIRSVDIIDLDYPYWHTVQDTTNKVSAASLQKVGDTLLAWIRDYGSCIEQQNCNEK